MSALISKIMTFSQQKMMKIVLALTLIGIFNTAFSLPPERVGPVESNPACWFKAKMGFPFYGQETITLYKMTENHKKNWLRIRSFSSTNKVF